MIAKFVCGEINAMNNYVLMTEMFVQSVARLLNINSGPHHKQSIGVVCCKWFPWEDSGPRTSKTGF